MKLPPLLNIKGAGIGCGEEVEPPKELNIEIHVTRGGIISPGKKKLIKSPPLPDPRGIWLEADVIQRGEAKGKGAPPTLSKPTARSTTGRLQLELGREG